LSAIVVSNSNGVSFGLNGSTLTGSVATSLTNINVSAGTTSNNLSAVTFSNLNNITFGLNAGTITASVAAPGTTGITGLVAGAQTATQGSISFADSNGFSWGASGSSRITASFNAIKSISAGTTRVTSGEAVFSNSNGVSFGADGNTITASVAAAAVATLSYYDNLNADAGMSALGVGSQMDGTILFFPLFYKNEIFPGVMTASSFLLDMSGLAAQTVDSHTYSLSFGIYTISASSTLNLLNSGSTSWNVVASSKSISTFYGGRRYLSIHTSLFSAQPTFSQTHYVGAINIRSVGLSVAFSLFGQSFYTSGQRSGTMGVNASATSQGFHPYLGQFSVTTAAFPATVNINQLSRTGLSAAFLPHVILNNLVSAF
jgi:hypothetical protein